MNKTLSKAVLAIVFSLASLSASAANYSFTLLDGPVGSNISMAISINNSGQIVGQSYNSDSSRPLATLWNNGVATDLHPQGDLYSYATSINDLGQIVGSSHNPANLNNHAILWNNGVSTDINPEGSVQSYATSINNLGQIVGDSIPYGGGSRATFWSNGVATDISPQGSAYSNASSINNLGQVVGYSNNPDYGLSRATVWNDGVATDIQGRVEGYAYSINDLGQILGGSQLGATLWSNGVATALDAPSGFASSSVVSINNLGQIVGTSHTTNGKNRATVWNNGVATDLNSFLNASEQTAGWVLLDGTDINDNGSIVGFAINTVSGAQRGFLLQSVASVPEADTSAMLLMGAGVMGFMVRRRKNSQALLELNDE